MNEDVRMISRLHQQQILKYKVVQLYSGEKKIISTLTFQNIGLLLRFSTLNYKITVKNVLVDCTDNFFFFFVYRLTKACSKWKKMVPISGLLSPVEDLATTTLAPLAAQRVTSVVVYADRVPGLLPTFRKGIHGTSLVRCQSQIFATNFRAGLEKKKFLQLSSEYESSLGFLGKCPINFSLANCRRMDRSLRAKLIRHPNPSVSNRYWPDNLHRD